MQIKVFLPICLFLFWGQQDIAAQIDKLSDIRHPYLFFSKNDIPEIRERMKKEPFRTRWEIFQENANQVLNTSPYVYQSGSGKPGRSRKYLENAGKTAFAYVITQDRKYAERAIQEAMAMVEGTIPDEKDELGWFNPKHRNWNKGADLNTAEICYALAMVYDWCYDVLTPEQKQKIVYAIEEKALRHYFVSIERDNPDFWVGNPVTNWAGVVNGGVGLAALAIYNESEAAKKAVEYALEYVPQFLDHVFLKDGGGHEGIMYARYGELFALYFFMASQRIFGLDRSGMEKFNQRLAGYWDVYMQGPDQMYANFNNMSEQTFEGLWGTNHRTAGGPNSDISALMETLTPGHDKLLLWAADNGAPRFYWNGASPFYFLWRSEDAPPVPPEDKPELQDAVLFRGSGHAILRSEKLWLAYNGGWISDRSHNNRDLGSFVLAVNGERMIHDPGYGDSHAMHHSTLTINNEDQIKGKGATYLHYGSGNSFHYLATDLTSAYNPNTVKKIIRHLLMMKGKYIVLMDEVELSAPAPITWRLQTRQKSIIQENHAALIYGEYQNKLAVVNVKNQPGLSIVPWEGKNGKLNSVVKQPESKKQNYLLITVLVPLEKDNKVPVAFFDNGELSVCFADNTCDYITFMQSKSGWELQQVNKEKDFSIDQHTDRSIVPFRNETDYTINTSELPKWFFPIINNK